MKNSRQTENQIYMYVQWQSILYILFVFILALCVVSLLKK